MNKLLRIGIGGLMTMSFLGAYSQQINPMTEAVIRNYTEILQENPKDYYTLYDRAAQYYSLGEFAKALADLDRALECTPAKDINYKVAEYSLKSDVLTSMQNYKEAIETLKTCLALKPDALDERYKLGNLYLIDDQPEEALKTFEQLQRQSPRSQEAFYGMAKANVALGRMDEASKLLTEIENLGKQSYLTYCRVGDLYAEMGDTGKAATNYIMACTLTDKSSRPIESLKKIGQKDIDGVFSIIDNMTASDPDNYSLNYLKLIMAYDQGRYDAAEKAGKAILAREENPTIYRILALSEHMMNKQAQALEYIQKAENLQPDNPGTLMDKAEILMTASPKESFETAKRAISLDDSNRQALMAGAKSGILAGQYQDALNYLNNIILSDPSDGEALLLRGYLNSEFLKNGTAGINDYTKAGNISQDGSVGNKVVAALGKARSGKKMDADSLIGEAINQAGSDNEALYLIAVYFAQTGDLQKAKEYADKALINGYNNLYNLSVSNEPVFNLSPIHHLMGGK